MYRNAVLPAENRWDKLSKALITWITILGSCRGFDAMAQGPVVEATSEESSAKTQVLTRPVGAIVLLDGEYSLAGRAPYTITHFLKGQYRIKASKRGYEDWSEYYVFSGKGNEKLSIKLSPKTRLKSFARSVVFPGWGQSYSDQRLKGFIITVLEVGAAGRFLYHQIQYSDAVDDFDDALAAFEQGQRDAGNRAVLEARLRSAQSVLDDRFESRRRWGLIAGSIYVYTLLDALLFFPKYEHNGVDLSITAAPSAELGNEGAAIGIQARF